MASKTHQLRAIRRRLRVEEGRLRKIADAFDKVGYRLNAREMRRQAGSIGILALSIGWAATKGRDKRGAQPQKGD